MGHAAVRASAALAEFLEIESIRPLFGAVATHNAASFRVLQKCGFRPSRALDQASAGESVKRLMFELHSPRPVDEPRLAR